MRARVSATCNAVCWIAVVTLAVLPFWRLFVYGEQLTKAQYLQNYWWLIAIVVAFGIAGAMTRGKDTGNAGRRH